MAQNLNAELEQDTAETASGVIADLKEGAAHLADQGGAAVNQVLHAGQAYAEGVYESGQRKAEEAAFYAELGYEEARDWTRDHPAKALCVAAGVGLLIGILAARR